MARFPAGGPAPASAAGARGGLLALGLPGFLADALGLPDDVLALLDQRASVISMFVGLASLIVQVRPPGHRNAARPARDRPQRPAIHLPKTRRHRHDQRI